MGLDSPEAYVLFSIGLCTCEACGCHIALSWWLTWGLL